MSCFVKLLLCLIYVKIYHRYVCIRKKRSLYKFQCLWFQASTRGVGMFYPRIREGLLCLVLGLNGWTLYLCSLTEYGLSREGLALWQSCLLKLRQTLEGLTDGGPLLTIFSVHGPAVRSAWHMPMFATVF